jgi:hypothetical protein
LTIEGNDQLRTLNVDDLVAVKEGLQIKENDNLRRVSLPSLVGVFEEIFISENAQLGTMEANALLTTADLEVADNDNLETVAVTSLALLFGLGQGDVELSFRFNDAIERIELPSLHQVSSDLDFEFNDNLRTVEVDHLTIIHKDLSLDTNDNIRSFTARSLITVDGDVFATNNTNLNTFDVSSLAATGQDSPSPDETRFEFVRNNHIKGLDLNALVLLGRNSSGPFNSGGVLDISFNDRLQTVAMNSLVKSASGRYEIYNNTQLRNVELFSLNETVGLFSIENNTMLETVNLISLKNTASIFSITDNNAASETFHRATCDDDTCIITKTIGDVLNAQLNDLCTPLASCEENFECDFQCQVPFPGGEYTCTTQFGQSYCRVMS